MKCLTIMLLMSLGLSGAAMAQEKPNEPVSRIETKSGALAERIDGLLQRAAADGFGGAVIVEDDGKIVLEAGYGYANREERIPFTVNTIAQVGSLTKQFTAAAVLDLAGQNKIALDAPVGRYLEDASQPGAAATIHQLLTHQSGMPEYCGDDFDRVSRADLLTQCMSQPLRFEPGEEAAYSNPGYAVLAALVEEVSGLSLEDYLRQRFFNPLGMADTGYYFPGATGLAHGYLDGEDQGVISDRLDALNGEFWNLKGNGGIQASARNMLRWKDAMYAETGPVAALRPAFTSPHSEWEDGVAEGYGWFFRDEGSGEIRQISHSGSDGVFFSYFRYRPEEDQFLYFVGNNGEDAVLATLREVLDALKTDADAPSE